MCQFRLLIATLLLGAASAFTPMITTAPAMMTRATSLHMMDVSGVPDIASTGLILAEAEPWVQPLSLVLDPFLNLFSFAMLCRVVLSWYPTTNVNELPWNIVTWPTEPLLRAIRGSVPPAFGVDITPIVWLGIFTFFHEILLGQQGLLTMKLKYGI
jgi:YggT family protein